MHRTSFRLIPGAIRPRVCQHAPPRTEHRGPPPRRTRRSHPPRGDGGAKDPLVEFEMMTWPEVKDALAAGKTTALFYTGGTEQRGPQNVNGGHNLMAQGDRQGHRAQARQRDRDAGAAVHA